MGIEGAYGAHTVDRHVAKSNIDLMEYMQRETYRSPNLEVVKMVHGSYNSIQEANYYVNDILSENKDVIDSVIKNRNYKGIWIGKYYGTPTGREAFREDPYSTPYIRQTFSAGVQVIYAPTTSRKYTVLTAFPFNKKSDK